MTKMIKIDIERARRVAMRTDPSVINKVCVRENYSVIRELHYSGFTWKTIRIAIAEQLEDEDGLDPDQIAENKETASLLKDNLLNRHFQALEADIKAGKISEATILSLSDPDAAEMESFTPTPSPKIEEEEEAVVVDYVEPAKPAKPEPKKAPKADKPKAKATKPAPMKGFGSQVKIPDAYDSSKDDPDHVVKANKEKVGLKKTGEAKGSGEEKGEPDHSFIGDIM